MLKINIKSTRGGEFMAKKKKYGKKVTKKTVKKTGKYLEPRPYVIVRSHTAGVHAGFLESRDGDMVTLYSSRRLWRWCGASLSQVASSGLAPGDNKIGEEVIRTDIISPQGFEIAYCKESAIKSIQAYEVWKV